jgi:hypothetical protein
LEVSTSGRSSNFVFCTRVSNFPVFLNSQSLHNRAEFFWHFGFLGFVLLAVRGLESFLLGENAARTVELCWVQLAVG